jgi:hypothetical protein
MINAPEQLDNLTLESSDRSSLTGLRLAELRFLRLLSDQTINK